MKQLKFVAVAFLLAGLCSPWAAGNPADDKSDKAPDAKMRGTLPPNWGKLSLSEKQKQDIYKIQNDAHAKIDALQKQIDDAKAAERKDMEKVLTPAQKERLKEILAGKAPDSK